MRSFTKLVSSAASKTKFSPSLSSSLSPSSSLLTQKRLFSTDKSNSHSHSQDHTHDHPTHKSDQHHTQTDHKQKGHSKEKENPKEKENTKENTTTTKDNETNNGKDKDKDKDTDTEPKLTPLEEAQAKILKLHSDNDVLKDEYVRLAAEMENTRRIARKDVADAKVFGIQSFAKSMFEVGDNLSLALDAVPKDQIESNPALKSLFEGVQMTEKGFLKALAEHGVTRYSPLGEKFNPYHHQALFEVVDSSKETGVIANVLKDGYLLKDRVLRPASVGVFKGNIPQPKSQTPPPSS